LSFLDERPPSRLVGTTAFRFHLGIELARTPFPDCEFTLVEIEVDNRASKKRQVLHELQRLLSEDTRKTDIVTRFGQNIFAVLCAGTRIEQAENMVMRLNMKMQSNDSFIEIRTTANPDITKNNSYIGLARDFVSKVDHIEVPLLHCAVAPARTGEGRGA
jgi:hypothetical protein